MPPSSARLLRQAFRLAAPIHPAPRVTTRSFSTTLPALKKRKVAPASNSPSPRNDEVDALDFSSLKSAYATLDTHFQAQLAQIERGGASSPEALGGVLVTLKPEESEAHLSKISGVVNAGPIVSFPLAELSQIVPRQGRLVSLLVNDKRYIQPIMTAIQVSPDFNQQPQRSADNDLELLMRVEGDRPEELVKRTKEAAMAWRDRARKARSTHDKLLKDGKKSGAILPDMVRRAEKELQKLQDAKMKAIDAAENRLIKELMD